MTELASIRGSRAAAHQEVRRIGGAAAAFSDGVLAIALTLLVLDLMLDLHTGEHIGQAGHDLLSQWPTYLAYVASFIYIGVVWENHHSLSWARHSPRPVERR